MKKSTCRVISPHAGHKEYYGSEFASVVSQAELWANVSVFVRFLGRFTLVTTASLLVLGHIKQALVLGLPWARFPGSRA